MPNGRHRKPFSNKQKKEQLQAKREKKRNRDLSSSSDSSAAVVTKPTVSNENKEGGSRFEKIIRKLNEQPTEFEAGSSRRNRFNLYFMRDSPDELKELKKDAQRELNIIKNESELEMDIDEIYKPNSALDIPIRPKWSYHMSKEELEAKEKVYFHKYLEKVFENFKDNSLSYFEMNLETWRQLWRVMEISDLILFIVDIRFPVLHFSPVFYEYITKTYEKDCIVVLNKIDLVEPELVIAWKHYLKLKFPNLHIVAFTSQHKSNRRATTNIDEAEEADLKYRKKLIAAYSHHTLYECVKQIASKKYQHINIDNWADLIKKIESTVDIESLKLHELQIGNEQVSTSSDPTSASDSSSKEEKKFITIGCCGFPNVGKSSLLNSLFGKKVVSVSRTPGHTKHLQTLYLTNTVRLCDCPGLVFPSLVSKPLQILAGIYPIAQLQEPYSTIRYLSERIPIVEQLKITHPHEENDWSPLDICEAWAIKRRYYTAKAARPDTHRSANELLRMALDGRLCLALRPPNFSNEKEKWIAHPDVLALKDLLRKHGFESKKGVEVDLNDLVEDIDEPDDTDNINTNDDSEHKTKNNDASDEEEETEEGGQCDSDSNVTNRYNLLSNLSNE